MLEVAARERYSAGRDIDAEDLEEWVGAVQRGMQEEGYTSRPCAEVQDTETPVFWSRMREGLSGEIGRPDFCLCSTREIYIVSAELR